MIADFTQFRSRLKLAGNLELLTPLRIGAGGTDNIAAADITVVKDALEHPYIPGSSFKGVLRSHIESVLRVIDEAYACLCVTEREEEADGCLTTRDNEKRKKQFEDHKNDMDEFIFANSCLVCRVFGSPWLASKVHIADLPLADPDAWLGRYHIRDGVAIDRDTETATDGFLYNFEAVPAGMVFRLELDIENASDAEQGMVLLGLKSFEHTRLTLGGGTSRGLGRVKLSWDWVASGEVNGGDKTALVDYLLSDTMAGMSEDKAKAKIKTFRQEIGV